MEDRLDRWYREAEERRDRASRAVELACGGRRSLADQFREIGRLVSNLVPVFAGATINFRFLDEIQRHESEMRDAMLVASWSFELRLQHRMLYGDARRPRPIYNVAPHLTRRFSFNVADAIA